MKLAKDNPIKFLLQSSSDFFYKEGEEFCLNEKIDKFKGSEIFLEHFRDAVEFRKREFYRRRLKSI